MQMEVTIPSPAVDFNFNSTCTSPYVSAPSSPQRFGNYFFSAPTSPTFASSFFHEFRGHFTGSAAGGGSSSVFPFNWEHNPGTPETNDTTHTNNYNDIDFAFDFSGQLETPSLSADELFDAGKIKPLRPPSRISSSPKSPRIPRTKEEDFDMFSAAIEQTRRKHTQQHANDQRELNSGSMDKGTKSLSPLRISDILFEGENDQQISKQPSSSTWYKNWKLKDLLLFRSASEGRPTATSKDPLKNMALMRKSPDEDVKNSSFRSTDTTSKDPLKNMAMLKKNHEGDVKNSSFRSTDSGNSVSSTARKKKRPVVSAHELHYRMNRAVSKEMRRKTFLPYRQVLFGC